MMASGLSVALAVFDQLSHAVSPVIINESNPVARTGAQNPSSDGCITLTLIPKPSPRRDVPLSPLNRETRSMAARSRATPTIQACGRS